MPGTLHVVATPIGNLEDITLRALRVLREVALIAAEDTRRSRKLLSHHGIETPLVSYHAHNSRSRTPALMARLEAGEDVALITDAGTPGMSDPGAELVDVAARGGIAINPIPGASAPLAAASASGFPMVPLTTFGFSPHRSVDRFRWLQAAAAVPHTFCFFESPNRILETIGQLAEVMPRRQLVIARELTKMHQELIRGAAGDLKSRPFSTRGEFTVVVAPESAAPLEACASSDDQVVALYDQLVRDEGLTRRAAITAVARAYARPSREVYAVLERYKHQVP